MQNETIYALWWRGGPGIAGDAGTTQSRVISLQVKLQKVTVPVLSDKSYPWKKSKENLNLMQWSERKRATGEVQINDLLIYDM